MSERLHFWCLQVSSFPHFDAEDMLCFLQHGTHLVDETVRFRILEEWIECKGLTDAIPPGLYSCLRLERLPAATLDRICVERCSKELLMTALINSKRKSQRVFFESNDAFSISGDLVKTKSWVGHFWGWTTGPNLVSNLWQCCRSTSFTPKTDACIWALCSSSKIVYRITRAACCIMTLSRVSSSGESLRQLLVGE